MQITICDVGPRDGLQNDPKILAPEVRAELVNRLAAAGLPRIEAVSFVNPARVPQMAGAEEVVAGIDRVPGVVYAGLALNDKGYDRLRETGLDEVHFAFAASEEFNRRNAGAAVEDSLQSAERIVARAHEDGVRRDGHDRDGVRLSRSRARSTRTGCSRSPPASRRATRTRSSSPTPSASACRARSGTSSPRPSKLGTPVGVHLHNTRSTGFANAYEAIASGATVLDASVGGIGGCPFAPRATGNIATEDLVYMLHGEGIETGIDLDALIGVAQWLEGVLGRQLEGQVYRAGTFAPVAG